MKDATRLLPDGEIVTVNCHDGSVTVGRPPAGIIFEQDFRKDDGPRL
jgi:hypothetical protein